MSLLFKLWFREDFRENFCSIESGPWSIRPSLPCLTTSTSIISRPAATFSLGVSFSATRVGRRQQRVARHLLRHACPCRAKPIRKITTIYFLSRCRISTMRFNSNCTTLIKLLGHMFFDKWHLDWIFDRKLKRFSKFLLN